MDNENDTFLFSCPACNCSLELDVQGEVSIYEEPELKSNQRRGLGGLVTETNTNDKFYSHGYQDNVPKKPTMEPLGSRPTATPEQITPDPLLMEARENDLKKRNIK